MLSKVIVLMTMTVVLAAPTKEGQVNSLAAAQQKLTHQQEPIPPINKNMDKSSTNKDRGVPHPKDATAMVQIKQKAEALKLMNPDISAADCEKCAVSMSKVVAALTVAETQAEKKEASDESLLKSTQASEDCLKKLGTMKDDMGIAINKHSTAEIQACKDTAEKNLVEVLDSAEKMADPDFTDYTTEYDSVNKNCDGATKCIEELKKNFDKSQKLHGDVQAKEAECTDIKNNTSTMQTAADLANTSLTELRQTVKQAKDDSKKACAAMQGSSQESSTPPSSTALCPIDDAAACEAAVPKLNERGEKEFIWYPDSERTQFGNAPSGCYKEGSYWMCPNLQGDFALDVFVWKAEIVPPQEFSPKGCFVATDSAGFAVFYNPTTVGAPDTEMLKAICPDKEA